MKKLIALLAIGLISASAFAAQWDMYGSVRLRAFYEAKSKDYKGNFTGETDTDLEFATQNNSRIGAKVKADDKLSAVVELGLGSNEDKSNAVSTRLLYADYNFGGFKLRIGQDYGPTATFFDFNQVANNDSGLTGFGPINNSRYSQLKFMAAGLEVALSKPVGSVDDIVNGTYDFMLPRIEAGYTLDMKPIKVKVSGGYQTLKAYEKGDETGSSENVSAYVLAALVKADLGAFYANATGFYGSNTGMMGYHGTTSGLSSTADPSLTEDSSDYGFALNAGFKASDSLIIEAGYGYAQADRDDYKKADKAQAYYVNATYKIAKNFFIVPEIAVEDKMKNTSGAKEGSKTFYGAKFQANF